MADRRSVHRYMVRRDVQWHNEFDSDVRILILFALLCFSPTTRRDGDTVRVCCAFACTDIPASHLCVHASSSTCGAGGAVICRVAKKRDVSSCPEHSLICAVTSVVVGCTMQCPSTHVLQCYLKLTVCALCFLGACNLIPTSY
jgi:hypothetical protein